MLADPRTYDRLLDLDLPLGGEVRDLVLGSFRIRLDGLDPALAGRLGERWGGFLLGGAAAGEEPRLSVRLLRAGALGFLPPPAFGELYRIEARNDPERRLVVSYNFGLGREGPGRWRLGLTDAKAAGDEPRDRTLENAVRYLTARLAVAAGGFAMHAAAVLADGRAFVFAGPSGSGKTTVTRMARPARSLGDDFALVVPAAGGWTAAALPFDNSERVPPDAPRGVYPVAGIWRLVQAPETRVEQLPASRAVATLLGCAAFPWTMPESSERLLDHARRYVESGRFGLLHFALGGSLWTELL